MNECIECCSPLKVCNNRGRCQSTKHERRRNARVINKAAPRDSQPPLRPRHAFIDEVRCLSYTALPMFTLIVDVVSRLWTAHGFPAASNPSLLGIQPCGCEASSWAASRIERGDDYGGVSMRSWNCSWHRYICQVYAIYNDERRDHCPCTETKALR